MPGLTQVIAIVNQWVQLRAIGNYQFGSSLFDSIAIVKTLAFQVATEFTVKLRFTASSKEHYSKQAAIATE